MNNEPSIKSLLGRALDDVSALVRGELRLAQAEMSEKLSQAQHSLSASLPGYCWRSAGC